MSDPKSILKGSVGDAIQQKRSRSIAFNNSRNQRKNNAIAPKSPSLNPEKLPPVTMSGWLRFRPKLSTPDPKIKGILERARASRKKKLVENPGPKPYLDELVIIGESVRLNETGFSERDLRNPEPGADAIFFSPSYFPNETDLNKIVLAKTVFSKVFAPGSKFSSENPLPPCATSEFKLLKEGLTNRLYNLRMILPDNRQDLEDSMSLKTSYRIAEEINAVLEAIEGQKTNCTDYQVNLESGIADQIPAYEKSISREDTERMQNLLRQFSFLILQSINPVEGYEDKIGNITPNFLLEALEQQQISKEEMDEYLAEYGIEHEIPDTISQALQSTDSQDNIYSLMLESELQNLIQYVKDNVSKKLGDVTLKAEFLSKTKELENSPAREQIMGMLNWLLEKYSANKKLIADNIGAIHKYQMTSGSLKNALNEKDTEIRKLESELEDSKRRVVSALDTIDNLKSAQKPTEPIVPDNTINILRDTLAQRTSERDAVKETLERENEKLKATIQQLQKAQATSNVLGTVLTNVGNPKQIPFIRKIESIVNAFQKGDKNYKLEVKSPFQELYDKLAEHNGTLSVNCEFTYVTSFLIQKIFSRYSTLYDSLNTVVDTYLKENSDVLDNTIVGISNLLEASENQTIPGVGYYVIPNAENMKQLQILERINLEPDIIQECNRAFNESFRSYNKDNIKFIIPNSFIIGPVRTGSINKFELNEDNKFIKTDTVENKFPKGFSYQTLLILYALFIKASLLNVENNDPGCPKPQILTNPKYFSERALQKKSLRVQTTVKTPVI
jgi:hypothetical protein